MADIIDTAAEIEELQRNAALSAHRLNRNAVSAERCEECDEPIPELRRAAGKIVRISVDSSILVEWSASRVLKFGAP